jgi:hypothetical protein
MIEYLLKDADGDTFSVNGDLVTTPLASSFSQGSDNFTYDNRIVERSFLPGSALIGDKRLMARQFTMMLNSANPIDATFRADVNELIYWLNKTVAIVDNEHNIEIGVTIDSIDIDYSPGSTKLASDNTFTFTALTPYWSSLTSSQATATAAADTIEEIDVDNTGYLPAYPVITLTATVATDDVQIYISGSNTGIQIQDSLFGTTGNLTMVVDCKQGLVSINDLDRNASIVPGTGFFEIPVGEDVINVLSNEAIGVIINWEQRYFI